MAAQRERATLAIPRAANPAAVRAASVGAAPVATYADQSTRDGDMRGPYRHFLHVRRRTCKDCRLGKCDQKHETCSAHRELLRHRGRGAHANGDDTAERENKHSWWRVESNTDQ